MPPLKGSSADVEWVEIGDIGPITEWSGALKGVDCVIHLAGLAHRRANGKKDADEFMRVNAGGTRRLAEAVSESTTVSRLVFLSSVGAVRSVSDVSLSDTSPCEPDTPYGYSKRAAELAVEEILEKSEADWCIIRSPLVYGPGNPGNMALLARLVKIGMPLPFGSIHGRRSFVFVGNLVDVLECSAFHPGASRRVFMISDGGALSTPDFIRRMAKQTGRPIGLFPVPIGVLRGLGKMGDVAGRLLGRSIGVDTYSVGRLIGSLVVDGTSIEQAVGWKPLFTVDQGLAHTLGSERTRNPKWREPVFKRPFDFCLSAAGLMCTLPLWLLLPLAIWIEDGGPILFRQTRIGKEGKLFTALKFRSMRVVPDTEEIQATTNDPRITRIGKLMRLTALDELPQLINIFLGHMSFVGPRPQPLKERVKQRGQEVDLVVSEVPGFQARQLARPGLTGITQIYAQRDIAHRNKFRYDLIYVNRMLGRKGFFGEIEMFWLDLRLILLSVWNTLSAKWEV